MKLVKEQNKPIKNNEVSDKEAEEALAQLDVPYIAAHALEFQTLPNWEENNLGLGPVETTMLVALPEIDGAIAPTVFGGRVAHGLEMQPCHERVKNLSLKVKKYVLLVTEAKAMLMHST